MSPRQNGRLYQLNHCTYLCRYHLVWTTKYRGKILKDNYIKQEFRRIIKSVCKWKGFIIHAWHIGDEHIHLYLTIPPKYSVSYAICTIKGKSSSWIKKKTKQFPNGPIWTRGYFASTIGINEFAIKKYIEKQDRNRCDMPRLFD
jgi:putative transposase